MKKLNVETVDNNVDFVEKFFYNKKFFKNKLLITRKVFGIALIASILALNLSIIAMPAPLPVKVPIILYHNIKEQLDPEDDVLLNITPENFEMHMETLKNKGYNPISFYEYYDLVVKKVPLPDNPIIISFDDGYENNYTYAFPTLEKLDMKATIFVVTDRMGAPAGNGVIYPHFTWEQAREMQNSGIIDIESHSDTHGNMFAMPKGDMQREFRRSKYLIEKNLNKECYVFAFPYGGNTIEARALGTQADYKILCLVGDVGANSAGENLAALKRITISGILTADELVQTITKNLI
ncbi:hypothetical protein FACS189425_01690 [Clostridia bacterium]|nr:hypothetical protein FACS189425_01690 [Clostridia bacterium]